MIHFVLIALILNAQTGEASYERIRDFDTEGECQAHVPARIERPVGGEIRQLKCITGARPEPKKPSGDLGET